MRTWMIALGVLATLPFHGSSGAKPRIEAEPLAHSVVVYDLVRDGVRVPDVAPEPDALVTAADVAGLIALYPWPYQEAVRIATCESNLRADALNRASGAAGVFQIVPRWHGWRVGPAESLFNPAVNVRVAFEIWGEQGWNAWECKP